MANITTSLFQEMVQAGATRLNKQAEYVNSLNVFPVPDGDTGTNMGMTIENGAKEVSDRSASTVGEAAGIFATQESSLLNCSADFLKVSKTKKNWMEQHLQQPSNLG